MADDEKPTHRPKPNEKPVPRGYILGVDFHPAIKLDRKQGFEFAAVVSEYLEPQSVQLEENSWVIRQQLGSSASGGLEITIGQTAFRIEIQHPTHALEWIEQRCQSVLKEFEKRFQPKVILGSMAAYMGTMQVDGDARAFLARSVMKFDPGKLGALDRPVHLLGLRFFLPPFKAVTKRPKGKKSITEEKVVEWHVDVKVESLIEDPTKLYLEAEARWPAPSEWKRDAISRVVGHLASVTDYLQKSVVQFLQESSEEAQ